MRDLTKDRKSVEAQGSTIRDIIDKLRQQFPEFGGQIFDENGELHGFVNSYPNDEDIRFKEGKDTPIAEGDIVSIIPAIAGG